MNSFHLLLFLGSPFLGLEAVMMGMGGRALTYYRYSRNRALLLFTMAGWTVSCASLATSRMLGISDLGTVFLLFLYLPLTGKLFSLLPLRPPSKVLPHPPSEGMEEFLEKYRKLFGTPSRKGGRKTRGGRGGGS